MAPSKQSHNKANISSSAEEGLWASHGALVLSSNHANLDGLGTGMRFLGTTAIRGEGLWYGARSSAKARHGQGREPCQSTP
mgnify:CR=1 FL=1